MPENLRRALRIWGCIPLFIVMTVVMTFPLVLNMDTALDYQGDNIYNIWLLGRDGKKLIEDPGRLTEADILYPHADSYWRGNHCYFPSVVFYVLWRAVRNPVLANNLLYMAGITLNACAAYWLALSLWGSLFGALVGGLAYGYCPFAFSGYGTVLFQMLFWIPLALRSFRTFLVEKRAAAGWTFLLFCFLQFFTAVEFGFVLLLAAGLLLLLRCMIGGTFRDLLDKRLWLVGLGVCAICAVTAASFFPFFKATGEHGGSGRSVEEVQEGSADLKNYFAPTPGNVIFGRIARPLYKNPCWYNSPGYLAWVLGALAIAAAVGAALRRRRGERGSLQSGEVLTWGIFTAVMLLVSLGPRMHAFGRDFGPGLYLALRALPVVNRMRVLFPFMRLAVLGLCMLAGGGAARLAAHAARGGRAARIACAVFPFAMLIEYAQGPTMRGTPYFHLPSEPPPAYRWLADQPVRVPVLELPLPADPWEDTPIGNEFLYMYWQLFHGKPLVNGVCAFYPFDYRLLIELSSSFPSPESLAAIRLYRPRYIIVHLDAYTAPRAGEIRQGIERESRWLKVVQTFPGCMVLEFTEEALSAVIPPVPGTSPVDIPRADWRAKASRNNALSALALDNDISTAWTTPPGQTRGDSFTIYLPGPREIARVRMQFRRQGDTATYPRSLRCETSPDGEHWNTMDIPMPYYRLLEEMIRNSETDALTLDFAPVRSRAVRVVTGEDYETVPWAITEIHLGERSGSPHGPRSRRHPAGGRGYPLSP